MSTTRVNPALKDFRNFLYLVWKHLNLRAGGVDGPTPIQYDIADFLQNGPRRCIIEAFRGVGKSYITVAYVLWKLYLNPQLKVLVVSASKSLANNFTTLCFQLINEMELLKHLQPTGDQRCSKLEFDVAPATASKDPSVRSLGITSQITGGRADLIIVDDVESANNSLTHDAREKLSESIKEFDAVLKPGGEIRYLGTPQTELSIYNLLPSRGYEIRVWPARYPDASFRKRHSDRLAPMIEEAVANDEALTGTTTDPRRFTDMDLSEREASYGRTGFALQFMLDTALSDMDRYPLKLSDLVVMDVNPELAPENVVWAAAPEKAYGKELPCVGMAGDRFYRPMSVVGDWIPYQGSIMTIDPAGRGADELAYAVVKQLNGKLYVTTIGGMAGGYCPDNLKALCKVAKDQKVNLIRIEANFGDGMFTELLKPVLLAEKYPCTVEEVKHNTQKERRICDTLEPVMSSHRLIVDAAALKQDQLSVQGYGADTRHTYMLAYQLSRMNRERGALSHDDRVDVLAMAVAYWAEAMAQDAGDKQAERQRELMDAEIEKFMESTLGAKPKPIGWLTQHK